MTTERYNYSLADLGSVLTGALSQSAAPSEFRALDWVDTLDWTVDDLLVGQQRVKFSLGLNQSISIPHID